MSAVQVKAVGKDKLVLDLSCRKHNGAYQVATDRWQNISSLAVNEQTLTELGRSCGEFLVHAVDVEGKQSGIDEELVTLLAEQSPTPVTYAGGVKSMVSPATSLPAYVCMISLMQGWRFWLDTLHLALKGSQKHTAGGHAASERQILSETLSALVTLRSILIKAMGTAAG